MKNMAMPAANSQTAGMKKPTVNAADTARAGITKVSEAIMNETQGPINGLDITVAVASSEGSPQ